MGLPQERRAGRRAELDIGVSVWTPHSTLQAQTVDVAAGGISLRMWAPDQVPDRIHVRFRLDRDSGEIDCAGYVVRRRRTDSTVEFGVQFEDVDAGTRRRLRDFVASHP